MNERANEPAMPTIGFERDNYGRVKLEGKHIQRKGLTIREHFAGLAMQGIVAAQESTDPPKVAEFALQYADALIAALNQEQVK